MREKPGKILAMALEWANELGRYKGHELLVAEIAQWGFQEVDHGRHPDAVLKEMLAKIEDGIGPVIDVAPNEEPVLDWDKAKSASAGEPDAGHHHKKRVDP